jgi:hypothetical protein
LTLKKLPPKDKLKEDCKMLQGHLTVKNISDINGEELFNELLTSV